MAFKRENPFRQYLYTGETDGSFRTVKQKNFDVVKDGECVKELVNGLDHEVVLQIIKDSYCEDIFFDDYPVILALAVCACFHEKPNLSKNAYQCLGEICQQPHSILKFIKYCEVLTKAWTKREENNEQDSEKGKKCGNTGWGRCRRRAVRDWYGKKRPYDVAFAVTQCSAVDSWSHRDLLRLCHIKPDDTLSYQMICTYIAQGYKRTMSRYKDDLESKKDEEALELMEFLDKINEIKTSEYAIEVADNFSRNHLTWDHLPCKWHNSPELWKHLLSTVKLQTLLWNLPKLHRIGLVSKENLSSKHVLQRIMDRDDIQSSQLHPFYFLLCRHVYKDGSNSRKKQKWEPDTQIISALDAAFYTSIKNVRDTGKRILITVDGNSMKGNIMNGKHLPCSTVAAAMCLVFHRAEKQNVTVQCNHKPFKKIEIVDTDTVESVQAKMDKIPCRSGTDCARPMIEAKKPKEENKVDVFIIFTDGAHEASGKTTVKKALEDYNKKKVVSAKLIIVSLNNSRFRADGADGRGILNIYGFDRAVPDLMYNFITEKF